MERITPNVEPEHIELIEERKESRDAIESDAAAVRSLLDDASRVQDLEAEVNRLESEMEKLRSEHEAELEQVRSEYESELEQKDARIDELTEKLAAAHDRVETTNELVRAVEDERSLERRRAEASLSQRLRWWLTGMSVEEE